MKDKMLALYVAAQNAVYNFKNKERGAVDIIAIVVMIGIAIVIALLFKDKIAELVSDLFDGMNGNKGEVNNKVK